MKSIVLLFCLINQVHAVILTQDKSSSDGNSHQKLLISNDKLIMTKNSNFFDQKKDYRLGTFKLKKKNALALESRLNRILTTIENSEKLLIERGLRFNDLFPKNNHKSYFMLNKFRIDENSVVYNDVEAIFKEARALPWELTDGVIFSNDLKTKTVVRHGKSDPPQSFQAKFYCKSSKGPTICSEKNIGILYVDNEE